MNRISQKDLEQIVKMLNNRTGHVTDPYSKQPDGSYKANPFNYHLDYAYGGVSLHQFGDTGSGIRDIFNCGHVSKRELYNRISSYLEGIDDIKRSIMHTVDYKTKHSAKNSNQ